MKQILIVYEEDADENKITDWIKNLKTEACKIHQDDIVTRWLITGGDFKKISPHKTKSHWTNLAKSVSCDEPPNEEQESGCESDGQESLDSKLHEIADSLPYLDCMVYMFIFLRSCDLKSNESFVPLAGVLKRLVEWHNMRATIIQMEPELSAYGQKLVQFVRCQCKDLADLPDVEWPSWNGKLSVMNQMNNSGHIFPQFSLRCDDWEEFLKQKAPDKVDVKTPRRGRRIQKQTVASEPRTATVCGRQIEILQEVDLRTFPIFMMTSWTLELESLHDNSKPLMSYVQNMSPTALLGRLKMYYHLRSVPSCGKTKSFCTSAWKEYVTSSPKQIIEPAEEQISQYSQYLHLLILPNITRGKASTNRPLLAKVLLGPTEISPAIFWSLDQKVGQGQMSSKEEREGDSSEVNSAILSLPMVKDGRFHTTVRLFHEHQANAVKEWQDGRLDISKDDFLQALGAFQEFALDSLLEGCPSLATHRKENLTDTSRKRLRWTSVTHKADTWECQRSLSSAFFLTFLRVHLAASFLFQPSQGDFGTAACCILHSWPYYFHLRLFILMWFPPKSLMLGKQEKWAQVEQALRRQDVNTCPERLALQVLNERIGRPGRNSDNFTSLTPLGNRKQREAIDKNGHLEAVLESFRLDGTPKELVKSPLKLKGNSICRVPSQPDLGSKWPESQFIHYHDVYYYNTEKDLGFENRFADLRDKGSFKDTESSFVTPQKKNPARQLTRLSPTRSSPRSKGAHHVLSRSHSQSLSGSSPMKKFKTSSDLFKQPSSLSIRKSPRKRFSSSLTPTSDPPPLKRSRTHQIGSLGSLSDLSTPVRRSPRKASNPTPKTTDDPKVKRLSLTPVSDKSVRRSPRKTPSSFSSAFDSDSNSASQRKNHSLSQPSLVSSTKSSSQENSTQESKAPKMKRSERHKMRLQSIIATVLKEKEVYKSDAIYSACFRNLYNVSLVLLKTLPNSQNLTEEMKSVVYTQVQQIINLEKRRSGIAL